MAWLKIMTLAPLKSGTNGVTPKRAARYGTPKRMVATECTECGAGKGSHRATESKALRLGESARPADLTGSRLAVERVKGV